MYSEKAKQRRRCTGRRKDGQPCGCWAVWGDARQLCVNHAGRHHRGPLSKAKHQYSGRPSVTCRCQAYGFPHRPGAGLCRWPDPPQFRRVAGPGRRYRVKASGAMGRKGIHSFKRFAAANGW
jgi:hypothetical protein